MRAISYLYALALFMFFAAIFSDNSHAAKFPAPTAIPTAKSVVFTWNASPTAGIDGYILCYGLKSSTTNCKDKHAGVSLSTKVASLKAGEYVARVKAVKNEIPSAWSDEAIFKISVPARPAPPTGLKPEMQEAVASAIRAVESCSAASDCVAQVNLRFTKVSKND